MRRFPLFSIVASVWLTFPLLPLHSGMIISQNLTGGGNGGGNSVDNTVSASPPVSASYPMGVVPAKHWNNGQTLADLVDNQGNSTGASVQHDQRQTTWGNSSVDQTARMLNSAVGTFQHVFTNLPAALTSNGYDVYIYFIGIKGTDQKFRYQLQDGNNGNAVLATSPIIQCTTDIYAYPVIDTFVDAGPTGTGNYVVFQNVTTSKLRIVAPLETGANTYAEFMAGVQLVARPVPGAEYANWISAYSLSAANALSGADPDNDGVNNLLEFAFNTSPSNPASSNLPVEGSMEISGEEYATISFRRRIASSGITYVVESSSDRLTWNGVPVQIGSSVPVGDGVLESVTFRDNLPSPSGSPRFISVKVAMQ